VGGRESLFDGMEVPLTVADGLCLWTSPRMVDTQLRV
jgi:hypothetical protein